MDLKEIIEIQYSWSRNTFKEIYTLDEIEKIKYFAIALAGETGELLNIIKKLLRDLYHKKDIKLYYEKMKEELIDIFIYVLLFSKVLNIDLEKEWKKKFELNKRRFRDYLNQQ